MLLGTTLSLYVIALMFVIVRITTRMNKSIKLSGGKDDALVIAALLAASPGAFLSPWWFQGMGKDAWTLSIGLIIRSALCLVIFEVTYVIAVVLTKTAILLFYIRIFPDRTIQRLAWAIICLMAVYTSGALIYGLFQCRPLAYSWNRFKDDSGGKCMDITIAGILHGAFNMAMDLLILLLPMPSVYRLRVSNKKKVQVAIIFR